MTANSSSVGPNPSRSSVSSEVPGLGFLALTSTLCSVRSSVSWLLFQNDGTWVANRSVGFAFESFGGYRSLVVNVPSIVSLFDVIDLTLPASSCWRKYGLNGTFTRGSVAGWLISTNSQLIASSPISNIQNPRRRCGGVGLCSSGIPRPSGAGATRQPPLSRGIGDGGTDLSSPCGGREEGFESSTPLILARHGDHA